MKTAKYRNLNSRGAAAMRAASICAALMTIAPPTLHAEEAQSISNLSQHISDLPIKWVTVVLAKPSQQTYPPSYPVKPLVDGCVYVTNEKDLIASLQAIFKRNNITVAPDFAPGPNIIWPYPFLPRNSISLTLADQSVVNLKYDDGDIGRHLSAVNGIFIQSPHFKDTSFAASKSLAEDVRQWAAPIGTGVTTPGAKPKSCITEE